MTTNSTVSIGDVVDRYEIRELVGEGGMGAIYRAVDTRLGRSVALKVVRRDLDAEIGEPVRRRFLREALAMSKVEHRNVVRVIDFGFWHETPYLAMELLRGQDLGKVLEARVGLVPVEEVVEVMLGVCAAIQACHDVGVIHRDLKPSNIFLCDGDGGREVKILDFGISKLTTATSNTLTKDGELIGTPQFLAPEQLSGKALPQTDQYAIGVVLYQCLTKALPHQRHANIMSVLRAIDVGEIIPPRSLRPDLPETLEAVILRAMQNAPGERFESVHALGRALWEFASPMARERWQTYYFDRPPASPKTSTHAMPLLEALVRGVPPPAAKPPAPVAEPLASVAAPPLPQPPVATPSQPPPPDERDPAMSSAEKARRPSRVGWLMVSFVAAGTLALVGVRWWTTIRPAPEASPRAVAPIASTPVATPAPAPPVSPVPVPPAPPTAAPVLPAPPAASARIQKHHRRHAGERTTDASDGVPILP